MAIEDGRKQRISKIILAYPVVLLLIGLLVNLFAFGVNSAVIALPDRDVVAAVSVAAILLVINHTILMTSTELIRLKYGMQATPEEWAQSQTSIEDVSQEARQELERRHNAHRNATENTVYFGLLTFVFCLISPSHLAAYVWMLSFAIARVGHAYSYLSGRDGARGVFMSLGLVSLYGMASYVAVSLLV